MKKILLMTAVAACILGFGACNKSAGTGIPPTVSFSFAMDTTGGLLLPTYGGTSMTNNSTNFDSCVWNFGNDSLYRTTDAWLTYSKPGNYTLTLTVYGGGTKSVLTRQIHVYAPVLKQVVISRLDLNAMGIYQGSGYPAFNKVNVWVGIQPLLSGHHYTVLPDGTFDAPFIYTSPIQTGVDSTNVPITIPVPGKMILDSVIHQIGGYYQLNMYAQTKTGTYTLSSTSWSGPQALPVCTGCLSANRFYPNSTLALNSGFDQLTEFSLVSDWEQ